MTTTKNSIRLASVQVTIEPDGSITLPSAFRRELFGDHPRPSGAVGARIEDGVLILTAVKETK